MTYNEADHLDGKDKVVARIYEKLLNELNKFGPVRIEPKKTSIHLANHFGFAGVYTRSNYMNLEFHLDKRIQSKRIQKVEQASANRYHHVVKLNEPAEVDKELLGWLKRAYDLKR
ncbi:MAG: hypothetical protein KA175_03900 [Flavobacteriales bacterium]|nr:hypothetical protein [Flavobacteriales bacterium]MBP6696736.1 hypothetical protein [Flavobacteriales bacterium]